MDREEAFRDSEEDTDPRSRDYFDRLQNEWGDTETFLRNALLWWTTEREFAEEYARNNREWLLSHEQGFLKFFNFSPGAAFTQSLMTSGEPMGLFVALLGSGAADHLNYADPMQCLKIAKSALRHASADVEYYLPEKGQRTPEVLGRILRTYWGRYIEIYVPAAKRMPPVEPVESPIPRPPTVQDRMAEALQEFAAGEQQVIRIANEAKDAAIAQGADEEEGRRIYRRYYNLGMEMLKELKNT